MSEPLLCHRCAQPLPATRLGRQDSCEHCGADTRVCKNCRHYDRAHNNECREEQAGRQVDKEKGNFCEWFQPRSGAFAGTTGAPAAQALKNAADALFGKKPASPSPSGADSARAAAEALFKKKP